MKVVFTRTVVSAIIAFCICLLVCSSDALRIRKDDGDPLDELITVSPTLIYRRRLNSNGGDKYRQSLYPQTSPSPSASHNSIEEGVEEFKTDPSSSTTTVNPLSSTLTTKKARKRKNRSRLRSVALPLVSNNVDVVDTSTTSKPPKHSKSGRRRKVKRPQKVTPVKSAVVLTDEKSAAGAKEEEGDKNLALEIVSEDGKYALIDKFFTDKVTKAPGLLSYAVSNDFPKNDNKYTLGNVGQKDIWLSDGHLLVLKGGDLDASLREVWKPIDAYQRDSKRPPLKIALDSDNPPPFPVFVNETGPPVFLGPFHPPPFLGYPPPGSFNASFDPSRLPPPGMIPLFPNGTVPNFPPPPRYPFGVNNGTGRPPAFLPPPPGFNRNGSFPPPQGGPFPPPGFPPLVLNPHDNETDDPSIFLPPPYDFDYHEDNVTIVPPGPFAPGLVVPPPKDFYSVYNKTPTTTTSKPIGLSYSFGKRPPLSQRPNGKKPKFPITAPPDDSEEEAYFVNRPTSEIPLKKRINKKPTKTIYSPVKYDPVPQSLTQVTESQEEEISAPIPQLPTITTTRKPLNNFVYSRGQFKSLAEEKAKNNKVSFSLTPRPPYDERGYPTRVVASEEQEDPQVILHHYDKQNPTDPPAKSYYYTTPKYDLVSAYPKKPKKIHVQQNQLQNQQQQPFRSYNNQGNAFVPTQPPIVHNRHQPTTPLVYLNNRLSNSNPGVYNPIIDPAEYYNNGQNNGVQRPPQIVQLESPKEFPRQQQQQQPHLQNQLSGGNFPGSGVNYPGNGVSGNAVNFPGNGIGGNLVTSGGFRPAFGPGIPSPVVQQQHHQRQQLDRGNKALKFPSQGGSPIYDFQGHNGLYPQQQQEENDDDDGYYNPVTNYYQSFNQQQRPRPQQPNVYQQQNYFGNGQQGFLQQQQQPQLHSSFFNQQPPQQQLNPGTFFPSNGGQFRAPLFQQQQQQQGHQQRHQQISPFRPEFLGNYREPLSQYNTESEAVTTRTVFKAGPSKSPPTLASASGDGTSSGGQKTGGVANDGSYYSFQRGGPGGFSYKIRL